ncbi:MAG TPA: beta-propeller fold lactonase family protein [Spirochaetota bacterium]|nr:beta-propeller fold lactonase family protein [Spirochaetota bacterium]
MKILNKFILMLIFLLTVSVSYPAVSKSVNLKIFPSEYTIEIDGAAVSPQKVNQFLKKITLSTGEHELILKSYGYKDKKLNVMIDKSVSELEIKLEKKDSMLEQLAVIKTGMHPKSVEFTPDGKYMVSALLEGTGVDIISAETYKFVKRVEFPAKYAKLRNFVEIVFLPEKNEMWVSQMAANAVHVVDMKDFTYKQTIPTLGIWTKIITFSNDHKLAFVSNWESHDISVIDVDKYKVIKKIKAAGIPRGMAVTADNKFLYVCIFSSGQMQKIDLSSLTIVKTMNFPKGAKRHIILDKRKNLFYVSDMYRGSIYVISPVDDKVVKEIPVDSKLNTAKLTPDGKYIFVSSRGPNNKESYLLKGPIFGKVFVIDTATYEIKEWIWGRNQPTGLDISPDGKYMVFTNFLNDEIELYKINNKK